MKKRLVLTFECLFAFSLTTCLLCFCQDAEGAQNGLEEVAEEKVE